MAAPAHGAAHDVNRAVEGGSGVAPLDVAVHGHVRAEAFVDQRSMVGGGRFDIRDGLERLVVDHHPPAGVLGEFPAGCDHRRHRLARVPYLPRRQRVHRDGQGRIGHLCQREYRTGPLHDLMRRDDSVNPRHPPCLAGVDTGDLGVGERAPDQGHVQHATGIEVVDEGSVAADEPGRLDGGEPGAG